MKMASTDWIGFLVVSMSLIANQIERDFFLLNAMAKARH